MNTSMCGDCMNKEICGAKQRSACDHYDVALTRTEVLNILNDLKGKNPTIVPAILSAIKKIYRINMAYQF
jgi:hypothetical protein